LSDSKESFFSLTPDRILFATEQLGKRSTGRCLPLNSYENRVYEIELEDDSFVVAKFYRPGRWTIEQIQEEHDFLAELHAADIPVVCPKPFEDGSTLELLKPENLSFCVYEKRGGRIRDELTLTDLERLGRTTARLHRVGERTQFKHRVLWNLEELVSHCQESLRSWGHVPVHVQNEFFAVLDEFIAKAAEQKFSQPFLRIHGDLHMGNVLWRDEELAIVDLDDAIQGPAEQDMWLLLGAWDEDRDRRRDAFLDGYASFRDPPVLNLSKERTLAGLRQVKFLGWYAVRWDDPIFPRSFSFFIEPGFWQEQVSFFRSLLIE
jgi:Ser/Thr protein kinase RdoA (MazF antagonist)